MYMKNRQNIIKFNELTPYQTLCLNLSFMISKSPTFYIPYKTEMKQ